MWCLVRKTAGGSNTSALKRDMSRMSEETKFKPLLVHKSLTGRWNINNALNTLVLRLSNGKKSEPCFWIGNSCKPTNQGLLHHGLTVHVGTEAAVTWASDIFILGSAGWRWVETSMCYTVCELIHFKDKALSQARGSNLFFYFKMEKFSLIQGKLHPKKRKKFTGRIQQRRE